MSSSLSSLGDNSAHESKNSDSSNGGNVGVSENKVSGNDDIPNDGFRLPPSMEDPEDDSGYDTDYGRISRGSS
ncbi:hypothetical protein F4805DRAFT_476792 [Annulohypoxylon moriforme]|nr:hypothetical protein F4805DRAFT_476792 [Annulohypoxylon moriforme]